MSEHAAQLDAMLAVLADGSLSPTDGAALAARLRDDPSMQDAYLDYLELHATLAWELTEANAALGTRNSELEKRPPAPVARSEFRGFRVPRFAYALAAALLIAAAGVAIYVAATSVPSSEFRVPSSPVATVIDTTGNLVVGDGILSAGDALRAGDVSLDGGSAEFQLTNGVTVRLAGPTRLTVHDPMSATLAAGVATFDCPPIAKGYTVHLPDGARVVDLGTAFTIAVNDRGGAAVRVIEGRVALSLIDDSTGRRVVETCPLAAPDRCVVLTHGKLVADPSYDGRRRVTIGPLAAPAIVGTPSVFPPVPDRFAAEHLLDDQIEGVGADWAGHGVGPHAITLDLGDAVWLHGLRWAHRVDSGNPPVDIARRLELTFSDDAAFDEQDATLTVEPDASPGVQTILFPAYRARFVRVTVVGVAGNTGGAMLKFLGERVEPDDPIEPSTSPIVDGTADRPRSEHP